MVHAHSINVDMLFSERKYRLEVGHRALLSLIWLLLGGGSEHNLPSRRKLEVRDLERRGTYREDGRLLGKGVGYIPWGGGEN